MFYNRAKVAQDKEFGKCQLKKNRTMANIKEHGRTNKGTNASC